MQLRLLLVVRVLTFFFIITKWGGTCPYPIYSFGVCREYSFGNNYFCTNLGYRCDAKSFNVSIFLIFGILVHWTYGYQPVIENASGYAQILPSTNRTVFSWATIVLKNPYEAVDPVWSVVIDWNVSAVCVDPNSSKYFFKNVTPVTVIQSLGCIIIAKVTSVQ